MIYTVTINPAIDLIIGLDFLTKGKVNRSLGQQIFYGGKGINVSTVLTELGIETTALGFVCGFTGAEIERGLAEKGVNHRFIHLPNGMTRINVKIKSSEETDINDPGPRITENDLEKLYLEIDKIESGDTLVISGSVPKTLPDDLYETIIARVADKGVKLVIDAEQKLLLNCLKYKPFLVKPNKEELGQMFDVKIKTIFEVEHYAKKLKEMGAVNVLVSLAGDGSLLIDEHGETHLMGTAKGRVVSSVGAGDSMVAGFIAGYIEKGDYAHAHKLGTAAGGATAFSAGLADKDKILRLYDSLK